MYAWAKASKRQSPASLVFLLAYTDLDFIILPSEIFHSLDVFLLTSIPFFILAGRLMNEGGITQRLVRFSRLIVGNVRGSLAQVNVVTSMFFGGITGSAVADTSAVGSVKVEMRDAEGRPRTGFRLDDCPEKYGDQIEGMVKWAGRASVGPLAGETVRLRFVLKDADLYAFKFNS